MDTKAEAVARLRRAHAEAEAASKLDQRRPGAEEIEALEAILKALHRGERYAETKPTRADLNRLSVLIGYCQIALDHWRYSIRFRAPNTEDFPSLIDEFNKLLSDASTEDGE